MESYRSQVRQVFAVLAGLSIVFLLLVLWNVCAPMPPVTVPTPILPHPNAYDFYAQAGTVMVAGMDVRDATAAQPSAHECTMAEKADLVAQNESTLQIARKGFFYPYLQPPVRSLSVIP